MAPTCDPPPRVKPPWQWKAPADTAAIGCVNCHDNGALIRSPYLTQITGAARQLPGAGDVTYNQNQPYFFVGRDFAAWKAFKVQTSNGSCTSCHRLGTSTFDTSSTRGTALDFAARATAASNPAKNPHSPLSPMWMLKNEWQYDAAHAAEADAVGNCAATRNLRPLFNSANCKVTLFTGRALGAPAGNPTAYARIDGVSAVVFPGTLNHVYELKLLPSGWQQADISNGAPVISGSPAAYRRSDQFDSVVYRSADNHVRELYHSTGSWGAGDLSANAGALAAAKLAAGNPSGYVRQDGVNAVVYRGTDNHVYELRLTSSNWVSLDLSNSASATSAAALAVSDPVGFVRSDGVSAVVYRSADNHVRDVFLDATGWHAEDLSALSGSSAVATGTPSAYVRNDDVSIVLYRSDDGHVRELSLKADLVRLVPGLVVRPWAASDLSLATGAPLAAGNPSGYVRSDNINSVLYRDVLGHLRELTLDALNGGSWQKWDFYSLSGSAAPVGDPRGFVRADMTDSVVFKTSDTHVRELRNTNSGWALTDLTVASGN